MSVVLDTSVLIDHLRGKREAARYLEGLQTRPACSEISRVEILRGLRSGERPTAERLFALLAWRSVDEEVARVAGRLGRQYRRSHPGLGPADLVVAATAEMLSLPLATANIRHFPMFDGLTPPY